MRRVYSVCPYCDKKFRTYHPQPEWVCEQCESDATADAVSAITSELNRAVAKRLAICHHDGCLLKGLVYVKEVS
jgi:ribosomal protein L37AE/L43A